MLETLTELLCYFAPTLVAWYRKSQGKDDTLFPSIGRFAVLNLAIAWTVAGWFLLMANAFGINPVPWLVNAFVGKKAVDEALERAREGESGPTSSSRPGPPADSPSTVMCSSCGGSGSVMCSTCQGRGSWYTQPTTANGASQLQTCGACLSSGRLRCTYCGGSGRVSGPIG